MNSIKYNPQKGLRGDSNMGRIIYLHLKNQKFADTTCDRVFYDDELEDSEKEENYYYVDVNEENDGFRYMDNETAEGKIDLASNEEEKNEEYGSYLDS